MKRSFAAIGLAVAAGVAVVSLSLMQFGDAKADREEGPRFKVDASWPKALPNKWLIGQVPGIQVDRDDNIWIVQRPRTLTNDERGASAFDIPVAPIPTPPPLDGPARSQGSISDCCLPAPSVMQFDPKGNLLRAWGGPADPGKCVETLSEATTCQWPNTEHGIYVDDDLNVWLGGQAGGAVLKFSADGQFLLQIGRRQPPVRNNNLTTGGVNGTPLLAQPADLEGDLSANEMYIADGYTNNRVIVVDATTGLYKRHWGAYGQNPVSDLAPPTYVKNQAPSPNFANPVHAIKITKDGLVYVADRVNNRIQVFDKTKVGAPCVPAGPGTCGFIKEFFLDRETLGPGAAWDIDTSPDRREKYLYNADGSNNYIAVLNRQTGAILSTFGRNGRSAGQFHWVHNMDADSQGNLYTAEVDTAKRAQRFVLRGGRDRDRDDDDRD
jgi:DNA-binding beta-propeller fold protein YncE